MFCMWAAAWSLDVGLGSGRKETVIRLTPRNSAKERERHPPPPGQLQKIGVYKGIRLSGNDAFHFLCLVEPSSEP